jgi:hypothetical protein
MVIFVALPVGRQVYERVTALCSNLTSLAVKIILRSSITPELIVQLTEFKNHFKTVVSVSGDFW